ncbi:MAG: DUF2330 domain-containing protein [Planctomycetota bacterium]|nr:DUF2330 domain-containing protein [Planctomycetota bacterium]
MNPNLTLALFGALTLVLQVGDRISADPCGMVPPVALTAGDPELTRIGDQLTFVFFRNGIQDIVLRPGFKGKVTQFGMLIPFPVPPELRKVSDEIFAHVRKAIDPPEVVINLESEKQNMAKDSLRSLKEEELAYFGAVKVLKEEAVGMYQIAVLEASNPKALQFWMESHGYIYPRGMEAPCMDYIKEGWCFVAVKANIGSKAAVEPKPGMREADPSLPADSGFEGAVQAMGFRFRIDRPVVPMRLSAFNEGELHNIVYVLSEQPMQFEQLPAKFVKQQVSGDELLKNMTEPLKVKVNGGTLEQAEKMGYLKRPEYSRDPSPHNGHALDLFSADLLSVAQNQLSHPFEEREKELLKIGERLGLRGQEVDEQIGKVIRIERTKGLEEIRKEFSKMTLTVIEGDFPREVIAAKNLTLAVFKGKPQDERGAAVPVPAKPADGNLSRGAFSSLLGLGFLGLAFGLARVRTPRGRKSVALILALGFAFGGSMKAFGAEKASMDDLLKALSDSTKAEEAAASLIALGGEAVPALQGEAVEGQDYNRRGWAIVCLADIGDKRAVKTLQLIVDDGSAADLVKMWAGAALTRIRGAEAIRDLLRDQAKDPSKQTMVASVLLGIRASVVRPLVELAVSGETQEDRQQATAWLGTLDGRLGGGIVRKVLTSALSYSGEKALQGVPWKGGPLYLPGYQWTQAEALEMSSHLVCWLLWCEQQGQKEVANQLLNNLRDLSWRNGLGFRQGGDGLIWTKALLSRAGKDAEAVSEKTDRLTLILIVQLLNEATR